jgi:transmembrane sensor
VPLQTTPKVIVLNAGERVEFQGTAPPKVDRPALDSVLGWLRGWLTFDHTPLADAVAEFNRYNRRQILLTSPEAAKIRVDGVFRTADSLNFARAVASLNHLTLRVVADELILESVQPEHPGAKTVAN